MTDQNGRRLKSMYAIHFVLFVEALVLIHIVQLCLKSFTGDKTPDEPAEPLDDSESTQEEENDSCPFAPWSGWSECTVTCGDGLSVRHRIVLILENCTGEMVQARTCSQRNCPHDREFTFQRKEEEDGSSQFNRADEDQETARDDPDVKQEDVKYGEKHDNSEKHVTDYNNVPPEKFESENLNHNGDEGTRENDHGRARGHSWTSDDGHTWGQQSSFDSHGEADDNCFSDCSPSNPPTNMFGSPRKSHRDGEQGEQKSTQEADGAPAEDQDHEENSRNEKKDSREKENDDGAKENQKLNDEKFEHADEISNDEDGQFDAETDLDDDENFDDDGVDDHEEEGVDQDENEHGRKSDKKRKQNHGDEDDGEQDDLEQEEEEPEDNSKRTRRKKRRRRKPKRKKCKEDAAEGNGSFQVVSDPTEICDTFMAAAENDVAFDNFETKTANDDASEDGCESISAAAVTNTGDQNGASI